MPSVQAMIPCIVQFHRYGPTVSVGPFESIEAAQAWLAERDLRGLVIALVSPTVDTSPGAEVWL